MIRTTCAARGSTWIGRGLVGVGAALGLLLGVTGPAAAGAWSTLSSATAASLTLAGSSATSGTATAAYDGTTDQTSGNPVTPVLAVDPTQPNVKAGVLVQQAKAFADGTAAACAGVVGAGGAVSIGPTGACTVTPGAGGVVVEVPGALRIRATAITARCTAGPNGARSAGASLVGASVYTLGVLGAETKLADLSATPTVNSSLDVLSLVRLGTNLQTTPANGAITSSALELTVLGPAVSLKLGLVDCGPTKPTPAVPVHGIPLAAGMLGVIGWAVFRNRERLLDGLTDGR
ncbi:hypothetical protein [Kineococcus rhizosphaerae]|uniref:Uncharacterized protein n=1 Tax=Kineococcus rhizosphaerae TaxID=559628 RepID=A0A2T0R6S6_9ACTN|nr:hypothetical protein [Kineococcus rhizosphaerae]PRY16876.1 hypothetical protein CLV37_103308 [Kineococcus rhizosphaerae]